MGSLPRCLFGWGLAALPWAGLSWAEAESWVLRPALPCQWQGPNYLNQHYCFPGSASTGSCSWLIEVAVEFKHLNWRLRHWLALPL